MDGLSTEGLRDMTECKSCHGTGVIDIGDCENGVQDSCPECGGGGEIDYDMDVFIPERDAFMPGD